MPFAPPANLSKIHILFALVAARSPPSRFWITHPAFWLCLRGGIKFKHRRDRSNRIVISPFILKAEPCHWRFPQADPRAAKGQREHPQNCSIVQHPGGEVQRALYVHA
jgi:hypothetical protein